MASTVDAPPYTFVAKTARVSWDSVLDFDATPFTNGTDVSPRDLNALDNLARRLEEAKIEPQTGVEAANAAVNLAKLASLLQLSSEYQAMRAEARRTLPVFRILSSLGSRSIPLGSIEQYSHLPPPPPPPPPSSNRTSKPRSRRRTRSST